MAYTGDKKREYQRRWMTNRRSEAVAYLGSSCVQCGDTDNLEFDHKDRNSKASNISHLLSRKWEVLKHELDKCQLLCYYCHKTKSSREASVDNHGTHSKYTTGCRCVPCKAAHNAATTAWKRKKKLAG